MMIYIILFAEFFKVGLFAVGGGLATLPFLYDLGEKYGWYTAQMIADMLAVSESTPGPIGVNMATYTGFTVGGIFGGLLTTIGLVAPSVIIVYIVYGFLKKFRDSKIVNSVFNGIRPAVTGLIGAVWFGLICNEVINTGEFTEVGQYIDFKAAILFVVLLIITKKTDKHPLFYIAIAAIAGIVFSF